MVAVAGLNADYSYKDTTDTVDSGNSFRNTLLSAASAQNAARSGMRYTGGCPPLGPMPGPPCGDRETSEGARLWKNAPLCL